MSNVAKLMLYRTPEILGYFLKYIDMLMLQTSYNHVMIELCGIFVVTGFDLLISWRRKEKRAREVPEVTSPFC